MEIEWPVKGLGSNEKKHIIFLTHWGEMGCSTTASLLYYLKNLCHLKFAVHLPISIFLIKLKNAIFLDHLVYEGKS